MRASGESKRNCISANIVYVCVCVCVVVAYLATDNETQEEVAVKFEKLRTRHPQLYYEAKIYRYFNNNSNGGSIIGIPKLHWYGQEGEHNTMVLDLMGSSLEELFNQCRRVFSLKTVLMLADQMIQRLQFVHTRSLVHRDIKPDNFLMGVGNKAHILHIIDFGLAKKYRDSRRLHIPFRDDKKFTGTARYASLAAQAGIEQSRRDDLEAVGLILIYFLRGSLPWQGLRAATRKQKYQKILDRKKTVSITELCRGYPSEFAAYLNYCRSLHFSDRPDYTRLRTRFRDLFERQGYTDDSIFDWTGISKSVGVGGGGGTFHNNQAQA